VILAALERGDECAAITALAAHINWHRHYDFEAVLVERREQSGN
jgi:hypothetical protein